MPPDQQRPNYSQSQIAKYFDRLQLPDHQRRYDVNVAGLKPDQALEYLGLLQKSHLAHVPFENLSLHYSTHRQICIHPEELFKKVIGDANGRGGYCMETNCLFGTLLHTIGYDVYSAGARVFAGDSWTGWSHMVNFVKIGGVKYLVDVGFGGNGPVAPMALDRSGPIQKHVAPGAARLQWKNIIGNTDPDQRLWVLEYRIDDNSDFMPAYCFTELEFLPCDYQIMNYFTSTSLRIFFTRNIVMEKKLLGSDGELEGSLILNDDVLKWRIKGEKTREIKFASEEERVNALKEHYGITLSAAEKDGIIGLPSQIR